MAGHENMEETQGYADQIMNVINMQKYAVPIKEGITTRRGGTSVDFITEHEKTITSSGGVTIPTLEKVRLPPPGIEITKGKALTQKTIRRLRSYI